MQLSRQEAVYFQYSQKSARGGLCSVFARKGPLEPPKGPQKPYIGFPMPHRALCPP